MKKFSKSLVMALAAVVLLASCNKESSEKKILTFKFASPAVEATVSESAKTIVATVPLGTDVTALVPVITISDKATISPASGIPQNFTNPLIYTVTAEDGSTASYIVTVTIDQNGGGGGGGGGTDSPTNLPGSINANTTWHDLGLDVDYIVDGWLDIDGNALVTVEPGVTIMFTGTNGRINVGENAGLKMVGTAEKPIRLVGPANNQNLGAWDKVFVGSNRNDNQFEYVEFVNGGSSDEVVTVEGKLSMKHCTINGSLHNGVITWSEGQFTAFENNTIKNCAEYPIVMDDAKKAAKLGRGNSYLNNTSNMIALDYYWLTENTNFNNQGIPYYLRDGLHLEGSVKMTIDAGVEFVFDYEHEFVVSENARFEANGTESQPIVFRGKTAEDLWYGIRFFSNRNDNVMKYCQIKNCGFNEDNRSCLFIGCDAKLTLNNNVFGPSEYNGVVIECVENWRNVIHNNNYFINCDGGNVYIANDGEYNGHQYNAGDVRTDLP